MPGHDNEIVEVGLFYAETGEKIGNIETVNFTIGDMDPELGNEDITIYSPAAFEGSFNIQWGKSTDKLNKKTIQFFRKYLLIDLLAIKFPKKKQRRWKRLCRRSQNSKK